MQTIIQNPLARTDHKRSSQETPLVVVKKTFRAPVEKVFQAWARADLVKEWWGPKGMTSPAADLDFRINGKYLFCMEGERQEICSTGRFLEIEPNLKIVMSEFCSTPEGQILSPQEHDVNGPFADEGPAYITVEFEGQSDNFTVLTVSHEGLPARMYQDCVEGWSSTLDKLRDLVQKH